METTHLQGIGSHPAIKAEYLKPGDTIVYNYGYTSTFKRVIKRSKKSFLIEVESGGKLYQRRYYFGRLVAVK